MPIYPDDNQQQKPAEPVNKSGLLEDGHKNKSAANLIREKVARIYRDEPDANEEMTEATGTPKRSKHQQFIYELGTSGKDLVTIQTEWHAYYSGLPDKEKYLVWQEFYDSQSAITGQAPKLAVANTDTQVIAEHKQQAAKPVRHKAPKKKDSRTTKEIQSAIKNKITSGGKLQAKHHIQSLLFGLGMGLVVVFIFLFGFFNEVIIAPFIQPSRASASTPIIISSNGIAPTSNPEVIIPKINVEIPINYSETSTNENVIEGDLQDGVVHYPTTVFPGQNGNTAFFGHSSNNIFNQGKYKFAFVLLHTIVPGDTFYLTYNNKIFVYKVITRSIVDPSDVAVLNPVAGQTAIATLITCDPPGTSLHRLVVVGQQISPDPSSNSATPTTIANSTFSPTTLPGNGPTLWGRLFKTTMGKLAVLAIILVAVYFGIKKLDNSYIRPTA